METSEKTIILLRHAKSSHLIKNILDIDRPLNQRGYKDAYKMARQLQLNNIIPQLIYSSPAVRAFSTALIFAQAFELEDKMTISKNLYFNERFFFENTIKETPNDINTILIAGHNPMMHTFSEFYSGKPVHKFPTSAVFALKFKTTTWDLKEKTGKVALFDFPSIAKKLV